MTDQIKAAKSALIAQAEVLGVEPQTIIDFLGKYELPDVIIQVNNLRRAKWTAQENGKPIKNPAGWLRTALQKNYKPK